MKIGFVLDDTLDSSDGVQQYVLTLGKWFTDAGHEIHYLVGNTTRTDLTNIHSLSRNLAVRFNGNRMSMPFASSRRALKRLLEAEQFDVLHVQMPYSPLMAARVIKAAPPKTVVFGTFHIAPHSALVHRATKALGIALRASLKRFDQVVSVSRAAQEFVLQTFGLQSIIVPNVVDLTRFRQATPFSENAKAPTIVFVGRLVPRKGCQILLEAVATLLHETPIPGMRVIICGRGPLEAELKAYATAHGLNGVVQFAGYVSEDDKARYLASADVAVFPSTGGESFGIVLIEAMAAERPVVLGADNAGYTTVLEDYPNLLFPVRNAPALANKIRVYLTDETERRQALDWQKSHVTQFDVSVAGQKLLHLYDQALRNR